jgi:Xaa-Pro aminopeptidase
MREIFTKDFFAGNRERLRQLFTGTAPIVITANGLLQRNGDATYKFRQDSSFWYLTGIEEPGIILVLDKGKEYLIVPDRDAVREAFDGAVNIGALTRVSGVEAIFDEKTGWRMLGSRLRRAKHVATLGAASAYNERDGVYTNPSRKDLEVRLKNENESLELLDLREHLVRLRVLKQPVELTAIRQAINITIDSVKYVSARSRLPKYEFEYEIEADLTRQFKRLGASGHAFEPIIVSGKRACVLHNLAMDGQLSADELLLFDIGAEVSNYAADISRVIALTTSSQPSSRQQAIHAAVCEVQDFALGLLKPGALLADYEKHVMEYMGEKLRELGLIRTISSQEVRRYYPHATSHFLGLDVHDVGQYKQPLAAGMVLTCEPGIYVPEEGIGVRIEDDVLITADGNEVLSARLSRELA